MHLRQPSNITEEKHIFPYDCSIRKYFCSYWFASRPRNVALQSQKPIWWWFQIPPHLPPKMPLSKRWRVRFSKGHSWGYHCVARKPTHCCKEHTFAEQKWQLSRVTLDCPCCYLTTMFAFFAGSNECPWHVIRFQTLWRKLWWKVLPVPGQWKQVTSSHQFCAVGVLRLCNMTSFIYAVAVHDEWRRVTKNKLQNLPNHKEIHGRTYLRAAFFLYLTV